MASSPSPVVDAGRRSTSTIAADMELGVGKFISSSAFSVGGHSWCIQYYPDGYTKENADWISVCLE
ncbi:MATH domain-containing protein, partial [Klebsiella pneumoniae]